MPEYKLHEVRDCAVSFLHVYLVPRQHLAHSWCSTLTECEGKTYVVQYHVDRIINDHYLNCVCCFPWQESPTVGSFRLIENPASWKWVHGRDICTSIFVAALFTTSKIWKQPKCPRTDDWIKKMWYSHTVECYSAIKKNDIISFATTWMVIMLSGISQAQKDKHYMFSLICGT